MEVQRGRVGSQVRFRGQGISLSEYQAEAFWELYKGVLKAVIDNYVETSRFPFAERRNAGIVLERLSMPDPVKFSEDFPVFYGALKLPEV